MAFEEPAATSCGPYCFILDVLRIAIGPIQPVVETSLIVNIVPEFQNNSEAALQTCDQ